MLKLSTVGCLMLFLGGYANADVEFHIGGFGSLGLIHSSNKSVDFSTDTKSNGAGYTRSTDFATDSLAAVQVDAKFNEQWSATVQAMTQKNDGHNDFSPHIEWANIKYKPTSKLSIHLGRMGIPAFMVSDYRKVNYASVWERAPIEVYNQVPVTSGDGIGVRYQTDLGDGTLNVQGMYFSSSIQSFQRDQVDVNSAKLLTASYEKDAMTFRLLWATTPVDFAPKDIQMIRAALNTVPGGSAISDGKFAPSGKGDYMAAGFSYDPGDWLVQSEYTRRVSKLSTVPNSDTGYILLGKHLKKFTPYFMVSRLHVRGPFSDPFATFLAEGGAGPAAIPLGMMTNLALAHTNQSQTTTAIGVRYDVVSNVAIKAQYDYVRPDKGSYGMSIYPDPLMSPAGKTHLVSLNLDFVF